MTGCYPVGGRECLNPQTRCGRMQSPSRSQESLVPVQRLNHAVLYVRDVERSHAFYRDVLGFRARTEIPGAAVFLQAEGSTNDHDLNLFKIVPVADRLRPIRHTVGLYHLAWEVDTLAKMS